MKTKYIFWIAIIIAPLVAVAQGDKPPHPRVVVIGDGHVINCTSEPLEIGVEVVDWQPGFTYSWEDGTSDSIRLVKPENTTAFVITVSNASIDFNAVKVIEVRVFNAPVFADDEEITIDKFTCPGRDLELAIDPYGGHAPYRFEWSIGSQEARPVVNPTVNTTYDVTVTDACGSQTNAQVLIAFEEHEPIEVPGSQYVTIECVGEMVSFAPDLSLVSGGVGYGYQYSFDGWNSVNEPQEMEATESLTLEALVSDACGIQERKVAFVIDRLPLDIPEPEPLVACKGDEVQITDSHDGFYYWDGHVMHTAFTQTADEDTGIPLVYIDRCGDNREVVKNLVIRFVESDFDVEIDHIERHVSLSAVDRSSDSEFQWFLNGAPVSTLPHPEFALLEAGEHEVTLEVEDGNGCMETTTRIIVIQGGADVPLAFSPNNDGLNDHFSVHFEDQLRSFNIKIFNRWGQLIYESNDQYFEWDGRELGRNPTLDSYAYILKAVSSSGKLIEKNGTITTLIQN